MVGSQCRIMASKAINVIKKLVVNLVFVKKLMSFKGFSFPIGFVDFLVA